MVGGWCGWKVVYRNIAACSGAANDQIAHKHDGSKNWKEIRKSLETSSTNWTARPRTQKPKTDVIVVEIKIYAFL
jgi:hypothetical protein